MSALRMTTSLQVFRVHMKRREEDGTLDAAGVVSRECYLHWLDTKLAQESDEEARKYHRTLTNHVSGVDGRSPFDPEEEQAILVMFRKRQPWPCLPAHMAGMGKRYRTKGFHEKIRDGLAARPSPSSSSPSPSPSSALAHAAPSLSPVRLPPSLISTAAFTHQRELSTCDVDRLLNSLSLQDRSYVKDLSCNVVTNFASPSFTLQDWHTVNSIFRFMILARTKKAALGQTREQQLASARQLCERFTQNDKEMVSMVFDMAANTYVERAMVQNAYSFSMIGPILRNEYARGVDGSELFSVVLAVAAAYLRPGTNQLVPNQKHWCADDTVRAFDMSFYVDPDSLLFVVWGKLSKV